MISSDQPGSPLSRAAATIGSGSRGALVLAIEVTGGPASSRGLGGLFWQFHLHLPLVPARFTSACCKHFFLIPYPPRVVKGQKIKMSHLTRERLDLVTRTKKIVGQLESVLRSMEEDAHCADLLQRLAAARGAINSLMAELMEDHILNHMPRKTKASAEAAQDMIEIVRTYLK